MERWFWWFDWSFAEAWITNNSTTGAIGNHHSRVYRICTSELTVLFPSFLRPNAATQQKQRLCENITLFELHDLHHSPHFTPPRSQNGRSQPRSLQSTSPHSPSHPILPLQSSSHPKPHLPSSPTINILSPVRPLHSLPHSLDVLLRHQPRRALLSS